MENGTEVLQKLKIELPCNPAVSLLIYIQNNQNHELEQASIIRALNNLKVQVLPSQFRKSLHFFLATSLSQALW